METKRRTVLLTRTDVAELLGVSDCIVAVERAFCLHADRSPMP